MVCCTYVGFANLFAGMKLSVLVDVFVCHTSVHFTDVVHGAVTYMLECGVAVYNANTHMHAYREKPGDY